VGEQDCSIVVVEVPHKKKTERWALTHGGTFGKQTLPMKGKKRGNLLRKTTNELRFLVSCWIKREEKANCGFPLSLGSPPKEKKPKTEI